MSDTPDHHNPETLIAFDFGHRRIGVAVGQQITGSARPLGAASNGSTGPDWQQITHWIKDWNPDRLVVGLPLHADGTPSELSGDAMGFAGELARYERPVETIDERYTSLEAGEMLKRERNAGRRGRIRKETIDAAAAVLIAERWFAQIANK